MSLNIKNPEAHELATELALFAEPMEIAAQCAAYQRRDDRGLEEFLYDERGSPR